MSGQGVPPAAPPSTVSGSIGQAGRGGRGNNRRGARGGRGGGQRSGPPQFVGREPTLKGHIFTRQRDADRFLKTMAELVLYVGRTYTEHTGVFTEAVRTMRITMPTPPTRPADQNDPFAMHEWREDHKVYMRETRYYTDFLSGLYHTIMGQCTNALESKLKSMPGFAEAAGNGIRLLGLVRRVMHSYEDRGKLSESLCDVKEKLYTMRQGNYQSLQRYYDLFVALVHVIVDVGVSVADSALVLAIAEGHGRRNNPTNEDKMEADQQALAIRFIRGANYRYESYRKHLRNQMMEGNDVYPPTLVEAYDRLQQWCGPEQNDPPLPRDGMTFAQDSNMEVMDGANVETDESGTSLATTGRQQRNLDHIVCYRCSQRGHYANTCTADSPNGQTGHQAMLHGSTGEFTFSQQEVKDRIPESWILLDSQSTMDMFVNPQLLKNVRESDQVLTVHCNAGARKTRMVGDLPGYGTVWLDPQGIANILSLRRVKEKYHVAYDSSAENAFIVTKPDGTVFRFNESDTGLYYLDTDRKKSVRKDEDEQAATQGE